MKIILIDSLKGDYMRKKFINSFVIIGIMASIFYGLYYYFFNSMESLPQGEFLCESTSPQGTYLVRLFRTNPALSAGGTRGEVISHKTGRRRTIYWEYNRNLDEVGSAGKEILWESDDIVSINGKRLKLPNETYDWRRD